MKKTKLLLHFSVGVPLILFLDILRKEPVHDTVNLSLDSRSVHAEAIKTEQPKAIEFSIRLYINSPEIQQDQAMTKL